MADPTPEQEDMLSHLYLAFFGHPLSLCGCGDPEAGTRVGKPPPALRAERLADHVLRDLVPLVRAAAAEVPTAPAPPVDHGTVDRAHTDDTSCWCRPFQAIGVLMHNDERIPVTSFGWVIQKGLL